MNYTKLLLDIMVDFLKWSIYVFLLLRHTEPENVPNIWPGQFTVIKT